jgi:hypothetical protein
MANEQRERALEAALFRLSERWRTDIGGDCWTAKRFRQMIDRNATGYKGGVWTVRHLLYTRPTSGFDKLRKHLTLTVETLTLSDEWSDLFDDYDRSAAKNKLEKF